MTFQELARKKVIGIPVIYLAGAFVAILAVVAWKMKPTPAPADTTPVDSGGSAADNAINPTDYSGLATQGTVTVVQSPPTDTPNASITTNQEWVTKGVSWLVSSAAGTNRTDGTTALDALNKYINGEDYSYDQRLLINAVISEYGPPPDGAGGGTGGNAPPKTQGAPPITHTVTGNSDSSLQELATLYYGANSLGEKMDLIQASKNNANIGDGPYAVGTKVYIPVFSPPRYYTTATANMTRAQVAAKNGITEAQLVIFNNGPQFNSRQTFPKGYKLRVG